MDIDFDLMTLVLSAVCVAEVDGNPMKASDLAFMLDLPIEDVDISLFQLVEDGSISMVDQLYRFDLSRPLTASEKVIIDELYERLERFPPLLDCIPARLYS